MRNKFPLDNTTTFDYAGDKSTAGIATNGETAGSIVITRVTAGGKMPGEDYVFASNLLEGLFENKITIEQAMEIEKTLSFEESIKFQQGLKILGFIFRKLTDAVIIL